MDIREFEDNWNKKLAYSGQRLEKMEKDCIGSQGQQQTLKWTNELETGETEYTKVNQKVKAVCELSE